MSRNWNGKALIDFLGARLWDDSATFRGYIIQWVNEIQNDLAGERPLDTFAFKMKKLLPTNQEIISLSPQIPAAPTSAIAAGGTLVDGSSYKAYSTFVIWDGDQRKYIESELSSASAVSTADASNGTLSLSSIDTYSGSTSLSPSTIWRRIYVAIKASGETAYGEPFFYADIEDNTTTTLSVTAEPTSTITPPSYSEVSQISSDHLVFNSGNTYLAKIDSNLTKRYDPTQTTSTNPTSFDFIGADSINLFPMLDASATTDQRTLSYFVHRRPHEVFYDVDREIDLPIEFRKALIEGVTWKAYEFRDRSGKESVANNYEVYKRQVLARYSRQRGAPSFIRDVSGDTQGWEV
mgnify:CR=1 FL=1